MWGKPNWWLSETSVESAGRHFEQLHAIASEQTDLGYGFRKQFADEIADAGKMISYSSYASRYMIATRDVASALVGHLPKKTLRKFSSAKFVRDDRVKTDIEAVGREKAVEAIASFYGLAAMISDQRVQENVSLRKNLISSLDKFYHLSSVVGMELDKLEDCQNAH